MFRTDPTDICALLGRLERLTVWSGDCRSAGRAKPLVSDERWAVVEPILPPVRPPGTRGHPPVPHRVALAMRGVGEGRTND
jgi:hypothetical protein